jgi:phosphoglycolate phosphatase
VRYRHIAFDLDGTLVDSRQDLADAVNAFVVQHGGQPIEPDAVVRMVGEGARVLVKRVLEVARLTMPFDEALEDFLAIYDERLTVHTRPYDGVFSVLDALMKNGTALSVITNKPEPATMRLLGTLDLAQYFQHVVAGDARFPRKPAPEGLRFLIDAVGATVAVTLLVGDSWVDLETARNAGCASCLALYGFGGESLAPEIRASATHAISRPSDLVSIARG